MEQLGTDFNATGSVMSRAELEDQRRKRGECISCGRKCFQKKLFKMIPISDHGRVLNGRCLNCHPLDANDGAIPAVSRPATKADLARFKRSQNNLRSSISISSQNSGNLSDSATPQEHQPYRRRASHLEHSSSERSATRQPTPDSSGNSIRSLRAASLNKETSEFIQPQSTTYGISGNSRLSRPSFNRPNSTRSMHSSRSQYSNRSRESSILSQDGRPSLRSEQAPSTSSSNDAETNESFEEYNNRYRRAGDEQDVLNNNQGITSTEQALLEAQQFARQFADDSESDPYGSDLSGFKPPTRAEALDFYNNSVLNNFSTHSDEPVENRSMRSLQRESRRPRSLSRSSHCDSNNDTGVARRYSDESLNGRSLEGMPLSRGQEERFQDNSGTARSLRSSAHVYGGFVDETNQSDSNSSSHSREWLHQRSAVSEESIESLFPLSQANTDESVHIDYQLQLPTGQFLSTKNEEVASRTSSRDSSGDPEQIVEPLLVTSFIEQQNVPPMQRLHEAGTDVVDILNVMRDYPNSVDVQIVGLQAISSVDMSDDDCNMLVNIGLVQVVVTAMEVFEDDLVVHTNGYRIIWKISCSPESQAVMTDFASLETLLHSMSHYAMNVELQELALSVLSNLALFKENIEALMECGAVESLVETMNKNASNVQLQIKGCVVMANLASHEITPKQRLVEFGGGSAVVISMVMHPTSPELQESALGALRNLTINCEKNLVELTNIGGIDAIISAMQVHRDVAGVHEAGAWTLSNLAGNCDSNILIGECGGVDVIVRAMWVHSHCNSVQEWCCKALFSLSTDLHNCTMILNVGGISAIVNAMQVHVDSPNVQEVGCAVLCNLAHDQRSKMRIVDEEALDAIVLAMVLHGEDESVIERACRLLLQLTIAENFKAMQASNVGELVRAAAQKFPNSCGDPAEELTRVIEGFISEYL